MITNNILIAEDNSNDIELIQAALKEVRLADKLIIVRDGVEALDYLECKGEYAGRNDDMPAVVLLDIKMPRMDGIETLERIRKNTKIQRVPVVMLTSSKEDCDLLRAYELGANAYVVKPLNFNEFMAAIRQIGLFWSVMNEPAPH